MHDDILVCGIHLWRRLIALVKSGNVRGCSNPAIAFDARGHPGRGTICTPFAVDLLRLFLDRREMHIQDTGHEETLGKRSDQATRNTFFRHIFRIDLVGWECAWDENSRLSRLQRSRLQNRSRMRVSADFDQSVCMLPASPHMDQGAADFFRGNFGIRPANKGGFTLGGFQQLRVANDVRDAEARAVRPGACRKILRDRAIPDRVRRF